MSTLRHLSAATGRRHPAPAELALRHAPSTAQEFRPLSRWETVARIASRDTNHNRPPRITSGAVRGETVPQFSGIGMVIAT